MHHEIQLVLAYKDPIVCSYAAWALEQIGQFNELTAMPLIKAGALQDLLAAYSKQHKHEQPREKIKAAVDALLEHCIEVAPLIPFVSTAVPFDLLLKLLLRASIVMTPTPKARQLFVTSGAMLRLQEVARMREITTTEQGIRVGAAVSQLNSLFPAEVVDYYSEQGDA